jgi:hypothetical protein
VTVERFKAEKVRELPVEGELCGRIQALIAEYDGEIGLAATLGVLDLIRFGLITGQSDE